MFEKNGLPKAVRGSIQELGVLLPVVQRVHSEAHPELADVKRLFTALREGLEAGAPAEEVCQVMDEIRDLTKDYAVPDDACPAFHKTYRALSKVDKGLRGACVKQ